MDTDEKLIALRKAYADILLNTSKEAAARVVVSEAKSFRLEKELNEFKGQALQMLLRSKKMMDSKVLEAEITSYNHQKLIQELNSQLQVATDRICKAEATSLTQNKKIDELEAQLNEAEDIVNDLRKELKDTHNVLERVRKLKPRSNETRVTSSKETEVPNKNLNVGIPNLFPAVPKEKTLSTLQPIISSHGIPVLTNSNESKAFIPSILLKSKGPEVCGNRRTQRVRAFEEKLMSGELSFTDKTNEIDARYEKNVKEDGVGGSITCKKVAKVSATGRTWRKFAKCKTKKIPTRDFCNKSNKLEKAHNVVSQEESSNSAVVGASTNGELSEDDIVESTMEKEKASVGVEKIDVPAVTNEMVTPDTANGIDDQTVTERVFKYTFQRKRKRESSSGSDGYPPGEEAVLKNSIVERPNCPKETEKCGSLIESSRDSRRLALVAHQLISLSEKKW